MNILYHGSKTPDIAEFKTFAHNGVDGEEVVFATSDKRFALAMIHGTGNQLAVGYFVDIKTGKEEMYIDELEESALELLNAPGILYEVPADDFISDERLSHVEFIAKKPVKVISELFIPNLLEELKKDNSISMVPYNQVLDAMKLRGKHPGAPKIKYKEDRFN